MNNQIWDTLFIIGSIGAMMWGMLRYLLRDIHKDLLEIRKDIESVEKEQEISRKRTDHLYEMLCKVFQDMKKN